MECHCGFDFISLMTNNVECSFHELIGRLYLFFGVLFFKVKRMVSIFEI